MSEREIISERTAPHTSEETGNLERAGVVVVLKARFFHIGASLRTSLWNEAFNTAVYIKN